MTAKEISMAAYGFTEWPETSERDMYTADMKTYACMLLRNSGATLREIANALGYSDHTSVLWSINRFKNGKVKYHPMAHRNQREGVTQ